MNFLFEIQTERLKTAIDAISIFTLPARASTLESDIGRRQILTSEVDSRSERVN